jgi:hypothetical protein
MRRIGLAAALLLAIATAAPALADNAHFLSASASINGSGALLCSFKEAGLGNTVSTEHITCSANGSAVYACINGGGNHPKATNKETVSGPLAGGGDFPVRNGSATGSVSLGPIGPGNFSCPSGQQLVLAQVSYTDILLTGSAGDTANVPGTLTKTFVSI